MPSKIGTLLQSEVHSGECLRYHCDDNPTKFYCLDCDSTWRGENTCPYCGSTNLDLVDDEDDGDDGRDFTPPYEP